jgi:hypothetical protein
LSLDTANGSHYLEPMGQAGVSSAARLLLALVLVCVGSTAVGPTSLATARSTAPEARRLPPDFFGINAQWLHTLTLQGEDAAVVRHAREMRRLGIRIARITPHWGEVEPNPPLLGRHSFRFTSFDRTVAALAQSRIRAAILLIGTPSWARDLGGTLSCGHRLPAPASPVDFASYAGAVVDRYGRGGSFWSEHPDLPYLPVVQLEVWNEPNWWDYWCPDIDPARYADLFAEAARRIHQSDPRATVVVGGLVGTNRTTFWPDGTMHGMETGQFLKLMLDHRPDARSQIDAVGLHTYGDYPSIHLDLLRYVRWRLGQVGLGKAPIVYNEYGWATSGSRGFVTSERARAAYLRKITAVAARGNCGVIEVDPYTWATREVHPEDAEDWFGIVDPQSARPYESARAYSGISRLLRGLLPKPPPGRLSTCRR